MASEESRFLSLLGEAAKQLHVEWHKDMAKETAPDEDRLKDLLDALFPGKKVETVTAEDGTVLFDAGKEEGEDKKPAEEEDEVADG
jgi:hypothetical protein